MNDKIELLYGIMDLELWVFVLLYTIEQTKRVLAVLVTDQILLGNDIGYSYHIINYTIDFRHGETPAPESR